MIFFIEKNIACLIRGFEVDSAAFESKASSSLVMTVNHIFQARSLGQDEKFMAGVGLVMLRE